VPARFGLTAPAVVRSRHRPAILRGDSRQASHARIWLNSIQFIQHDHERIEVKLVAATALSADRESRLAGVIRDALGSAGSPLKPNRLEA